MCVVAHSPDKSLLLHVEQFDNFREAKGIAANSITHGLLQAIRDLDEREEFEPFIRSILTDSTSTPHGPAEIADILTHKLTLNQHTGLAAFVLKGKSFTTVRPQHVSHQIYRLEKIAGLKFAIFAASGNVLDAAREQFCSTAERLGIHYSVLDSNDLARLFIAYGFLCPRDGMRIAAGRCGCGYSPQKRIFNLLQTESMKALQSAHKLQQRAGLIVLPTGSGKTRIAAEDVKQYQAKHCLYIAHTHEILEVAKSEFEAVHHAEQVEIHKSGRTYSQVSRINLSTIQLLRSNLDKLKAGMFDYIVVDEFHHSAAVSYRKVLDRLQPKFLLGLTATPYRSDRQDLTQICDGNVLVEYELRSGIDLGILAPYHYFGCFDDIDYSKIAHSSGRYDIRDLERALIIPERDTAIIEMWRNRADQKPTLAFCCSHKHAHRMARSFEDDGIPARVYLSKTPIEERKAIVEDLRSGVIKVVCAVDVLNEGADIPFVECLLFLRPTESQRIFYQQLGRGLRKYVGKSHCTVMDFIGSFKNAYKIVQYHELSSMDSDEGLSPFT